MALARCKFLENLTVLFWQRPLAAETSFYRKIIRRQYWVSFLGQPEAVDVLSQVGTCVSTKDLGISFGFPSSRSSPCVCAVKSKWRHSHCVFWQCLFKRHALEKKRRKRSEIPLSIELSSFILILTGLE